MANSESLTSYIYAELCRRNPTIEDLLEERRQCFKGLFETFTPRTLGSVKFLRGDPPQVQQKPDVLGISPTEDFWYSPYEAPSLIRSGLTEKELKVQGIFYMVPQYTEITPSENPSSITAVRRLWGVSREGNWALVTAILDLLIRNGRESCQGIIQITVAWSNLSEIMHYLKVDGFTKEYMYLKLGAEFEEIRLTAAKRLNRIEQVAHIEGVNDIYVQGKLNQPKPPIVIHSECCGKKGDHAHCLGSFVYGSGEITCECDCHKLPAGPLESPEICANCLDDNHKFCQGAGGSHWCKCRQCSPPSQDDIDRLARAPDFRRCDCD